ncbi:thiol-disulfide oxidoreductase [Pedobacter glucosidilyticus]|nr:redoxin domain-containing protein [Pedobacter glucosidilyticus]KHJ37917.1 thiol-disulfide oxidoreductase [Pedobacter glucosidilyticus]
MNDKHRIGYILPFFRRYNLIKLLVLLLVVVVYSKKAKAQQALTKGSTLPQQEITLLSNPASSISFPEKKKPSLLVFWNASCKTTQKQMQLLDSLQEQFSGQLHILTVTAEEGEIAKQWLQKSQIKLNLPIAAAHNNLKQYFPHQLHPHVVWLNQEGQFQATSAIDYVTATHLKTFITGKMPLIPQKEDRIDFKPGKSTLLKEKLKSYSMVAPHLPGVEPAFKVWKDSNTIYTQVINFSSYTLYLMAINKFLGYPANQIIWEVADRKHYQFPKEKINQDSWKRAHSYCYESAMPLHLPASARLDKMRQDLNTALNVYVRLELRKTKVWRLHALGAIQASAGGKAYNNFEQDTALKQMRNAGLEALLYELNQREENLPFIDETAFSGKLDLDLYLPKGFIDSQALIIALKKYHIGMEQVEREIPFLVFTEPNYLTNHLNP